MEKEAEVRPIDAKKKTTTTTTTTEKRCGNVDLIYIYIYI